MNSSSLRIIVSVHLAVVVAACSSSPGTSQSSDGTAPSATGVSPDSFCKKTCIDDDYGRCMAFATRFSDAFLVAYEACGDNPSCIQPKLDAAQRTARQGTFAAAYCAKCDGSSSCASTFWQEGNPGAGVLQMSDARLDDVTAKCLAGGVADAGAQSLGCRADFDLCVLPFLEQDVENATICHARG
jgi:hypothetical protein